MGFPDRSQDRYVSKYHNSNAKTSQDRFSDKNVEMYPDSSAIMFHASNVETFPDNNVEMFPDKYVPKQAMVARNLYHAFDKIIHSQLVINTSPVSLLPYQIYALFILMSSFGL